LTRSSVAGFNPIRDTSGVVEGLNAKAKVATRKAYGFKVFKTLELALYHNLGALPEPKTAHRFF